MRLWRLTGALKRADGTGYRRYASVGCPFEIEARKRAIPHANGSGSWMHTSFYLIRPDGTEKEYMRLRDAQRAAEEEP